MICVFVPDESFDQFASAVIGELLRGRLHEVAGGLNQRAANASIKRQFCAADGIDDHARRVW